MNNNIQQLFEIEKKKRLNWYKKLWKIVMDENTEKRKIGTSFKEREEETTPKLKILKLLYGELQKTKYDSRMLKNFPKGTEINEKFIEQNFYELSNKKLCTGSLALTSNLEYNAGNGK